MTAASFSLGKQERMKSRKGIDALFSRGRKMQQFPFRLLYLCSRPDAGKKETAGIRAGFTASSRQFPRAVDRNRLKRLMRERYRHEKAPLQEAALKTGNRVELFFVYTGREMTDMETITRGINGLVRKLAQELNESHS